MIIIKGLKNRVKTDVLVTLYCLTNGRGSGLPLQKIAEYSGATASYLKCRLPVFAGKQRDYYSGRFWEPYVIREAAERNGRLAWLWRLCARGRHKWCEESLSQADFAETVKRLSSRWPKGWALKEIKN